ncbi:MAG: hypothetical protein N4A45_09105 [Flavobacteriales bacterium]|jgi:capsule polysaccharide modification protein KpsS|nr:hypothetical protein [Flavobacteriales bacterium]
MKTKNIAFFNANYLITYFHEIMLNLVQEHIDEKDRVFVFSCKGEYATCDKNFFHTYTECQVCKSKQKLGKNLLSNVKASDQLDISSIDLNEQEKEIVRNFKIEPHFSNEEIRNLTYENYEIGYGILSSLSNMFREPEPDLVPIWDIVDKLTRTALSIYLFTKRFVQENQIDLAYVLNGRYAYERAFRAACANQNVKFYCFERGAKLDLIRLTENGGIHDIKQLGIDINAHWEQAEDKEERNKLAHQYQQGKMGFSKEIEEKNLKGVNIKLFTDQQTKGVLPEGFDTSKKNVVIFNSSEDEFRALDNSWKMDLYPGQNQATQQIFDELKNHENTQVYLRVHPNLTKLQTSNVEGIKDLKTYKNSMVIPAESKVSTYDLIQHADIVLVFGSSVGVEANYLRKPALLLGKAFYQELNAVYIPKTHEEVMEMIENIPEPKPIEESLKAFYFLISVGQSGKYFKAQDILHCTFKDQNIHHLGLIGKIWRRGWQLPVFKDILKPFEKQKSDANFKKMLEK